VKNDLKSRLISPAVLREIEHTLSEPTFLGTPIGPTLNDGLLMGLYNHRVQFNVKQRYMAYLRMCYHFCRVHWPREEVALPPVRPFLVTCLSQNIRIQELILPVVESIGKDRCIVACLGPRFSSTIPGIIDIDWKQTVPRSAEIWRKEYRKCLPRWNEKIKCLCQEKSLPKGTYEFLTINMIISTQRVAGCIALLSHWKPSVIVTEYDRNDHWSCLVLAAKRLGIPTVTLIHGVTNENALGYTPILADRVLCWGHLQKDALIGEGENSEKIVVTGCPRLNRTLPLSTAQALHKIGMDSTKNTIMLATSHIDFEILKKTVSVFCAASEKAGNWNAFIRLHPSERIVDYKNLKRQYPSIRFYDNSAFSLDDALAAADIVVVQNSGVGGDALVKGKLVVVLSVDGAPLGHGAELVQKAGCPLASSSDDLFYEIQQLLSDKTRNQNVSSTAETYVKDFCAAYGKVSAERIAETIENIVAQTTFRRDNDSPQKNLL